MLACASKQDVLEFGTEDSFCRVRVLVIVNSMYRLGMLGTHAPMLT